MAHRADPMWVGEPDDADVATVNAEDAARRAARVAELDRYAII